ncbi:MAG: hypothetical protein ACKOC0_12520, partial [Cytophagales bacterium]
MFAVRSFQNKKVSFCYVQLNFNKSYSKRHAPVSDVIKKQTHEKTKKLKIRADKALKKKHSGRSHQIFKQMIMKPKTQMSIYVTPI